MKVNTEVRNARILFSALALVLASQVARARQVINGDVIYPVTARAATERQSVLDAQTRAAQLVAIECGAPPLATRIDSLVSRAIVGPGAGVTVPPSYETHVEVSFSIADCEKIQDALRKGRALPPGATHPVLSQLLAPAPAAPARVPAVATPRPEILFTSSQLSSHEAAISARLEQRERERSASRNLHPARTDSRLE